MNRRIIIPFLFITLLIFMVYSNTFSAAWHFDDYHNILDNVNSHLNEINYEKIKRSFTMLGKDNILRALPRLSLAVNWYFGETNVFGYHLVNIIIHCINACTLFLLIYYLVGTAYPQNKNRYEIAIISALFWALHPVQISSVTYIVQRMASMAAMFYMLSMLFYLYGRRRFYQKEKTKYYYFLGCIVFFICAMFSKQNAALFPLSILLLEIIVFKNKWILRNKYNFFKIMFIIFALLFALLLITHADWFFNLFLYENRPFNSFERSLTQPRVLVFYLSLIFFPLTSRFSIEHYFNYSKSLFDPLNTFFCVIFIAFILFLAFYSRKKYPLLSFAIFFYFVNQIVESSFLSLEMAFEHRNYLPSIFIFVPIVLLLDSLMSKNKTNRLFISCLICCVIVILGISTYNRNYVWRDLGGIWFDALKHSPESGRVLLNHAVLNLAEKGQYNKALECFDASSNMKWHRNDNKKAVPYAKISALLKNRGKYKPALEYAGKAAVIKADNEIYIRDLFLLQLKNKLWKAADFTADILLNMNSNNSIFLNDKGFVLLKKNNPDKALFFFKKSLERNLLNKNALINTGYALNALGNYRQSEIVLNIAKSYYPDDTKIIYQLLNNSLAMSSSHNRAKHYCSLLFKKSTIVQIYNDLKNRQADPVALKLDNSSLIDCITKELGKI